VTGALVLESFQSEPSPGVKRSVDLVDYRTGLPSCQHCVAYMVRSTGGWLIGRYASRSALVAGDCAGLGGQEMSSAGGASLNAGRGYGTAGSALRSSGGICGDEG